MKNIYNKIKIWLSQSNRYKHLFYGSVCSIFTLLLSIILIKLHFTLISTAAFFSLFIIGALATGMEFKDKQWGGEFDWLDLLTTIILPIIIVIITIII